MTKFKHILKWILGIILLLVGVPAIFFASPFITGLLFIVSGLILFPPTLNIIEGIIGKQIQKRIKYLIIIGAVFIGIILIPTTNNKTEIDKEISLNNEKERVLEKKTNKKKETDNKVILVSKETAFSHLDSTIYDINGDKIVPKTTYKIISESELGKDQYVYNIRLNNNKLVKKEIKRLAENLKKRINPKYKNIFIRYYIPSSHSEWANSHFTPNLEVHITGSTSKIDEDLNCSDKIYQLLQIKQGIAEDLEMLDDYYNKNSQEKFESLIEGLIDVVKESREDDKRNLELALSCCPNVEKSLRKAIENIILVSKAYSRVYSNGEKELNTYKKRLQLNLKEANNVLQKCK